jgi:hypothetical protein
LTEIRGYRNSKIDLTAEFVRSIFSYEPLTGVLTWKVSPNRRIIIGSKAGTIHKQGRLIVNIKGKLYQASRIIWLYMTGEWPEFEVDHEDRNT